MILLKLTEESDEKSFSSDESSQTALVCVHLDGKTLNMQQTKKCKFLIWT